MNENMWKSIIEEFSVRPRDVKTVPIVNRTPKWFYVQVINNQLYVSNAANHLNSSSIKGKRKIEENKCDDMLALYQRRANGESVTKEATELTVNQVYWYGVLSEILA